MQQGSVQDRPLINMEAMKLIPCASAASDKNAPVSSRCCAQVQKILRAYVQLCCPTWLRDPVSSLKSPSLFPNDATLLTGLWVTSVELTHCLEVFGSDWRGNQLMGDMLHMLVN